MNDEIIAVCRRFIVACRAPAVALLLVALLAGLGCRAQSSDCQTDRDCPGTETCVLGGGVLVTGGQCVPDRGATDGGAPARDTDTGAADGTTMRDSRDTVSETSGGDTTSPADSTVPGDGSSDTSAPDTSPTDTGACTDGETRSCGSDTGACQPGTQTCQEGTWSDCTGGSGPESETCDGVDNDCDGEIDEELTRECGTNEGICSTGTETCSDGSWGSCEGSTEPMEEVCDGTNRDEDCDGSVDEGCDCQQGETKPCGSSTGACEQGTQSCTDGTFGSCTGRVTPSTEVCDGVDNDCDGSVDEELTRSCGSSTGVCTKGTEICNQGEWGSCSDTGPSSETCDGKDNDCDGSVDEGLSRSCGSSTGVCTTGTETCNQGSWGSCSGTGPSSETCDGKDNDCDGSVDEGVQNKYYYDEDGDGYGVSSNTKQACSAPTDYVSKSGDCGPMDPNVYPGAPEVCNPTDEDCDGSISDGVCPSGCTCSTNGVCVNDNDPKQLCAQ